MYADDTREVHISSKVNSLIGDEVTAISNSIDTLHRARGRTHSQHSLHDAMGDLMTSLGSSLGRSGAMFSGDHSSDDSHARARVLTSLGVIDMPSGSGSNSHSGGTVTSPSRLASGSHLPASEGKDGDTATGGAGLRQSVLPQPRMGKRFPINLDAALHRSASVEARHLHALTGGAATPPGKPARAPVIVPTVIQSPLRRRQGSAHQHRTSSVNSFTPFRRSGPSGESPDAAGGGVYDDDESDDGGGGGVRSYGSRDVYSALTGSTITSRQRRRSRPPSYREDTSQPGHGRCDNPAGAGDSDSSDGSGPGGVARGWGREEVGTHRHRTGSAIARRRRALSHTQRKVHVKSTQ